MRMRRLSAATRTYPLYRYMLAIYLGRSMLSNAHTHTIVHIRARNTTIKDANTRLHMHRCTCSWYVCDFTAVLKTRQRICFAMLPFDPALFVWALQIHLPMIYRLDVASPRSNQCDKSASNNV